MYSGGCTTPYTLYEPIRPPTTPPASVQGAAASVSPPRELEFARGLFDGIPVREELSIEDRVLVAIRCLRKLHFGTLGDFFHGLFSEHHSRHQTVIQSVTRFFQKPTLGSWPTRLIELMYNHPHASKSSRPSDTLPFPKLSRYHLPPSARNRESFPDTTELCAPKQQITQWALLLLMRKLDIEIDRLLQLKGVFTLTHKEKLTWDHLLAWNSRDQEELIAQKAPILFAILSTLAIGRHARKKFAAAVHQEEPSPASDEEDGSGNGTNDDDESVDDGKTSDNDEGGGTALNEVKLRKHPWLSVVVCIMILMHSRNQYATIFPTIVSMLLFIGRANKNVFRVLSRFGLSIAHSTMNKKLHELAEDSQANMSAWVARDPNGPFDGKAVFDNLNKMSRAWQPSLGHEDQMRSGTSAIIVKLENVPEGALRLQPLLDSIGEQRRAQLTTDILLEDIDEAHIRGVGIGTVLRVMLKHIPELSRLRPQVEDLFINKHSKHRLALRKSEIYSARCTSINESTTAGASQVIDNLVREQLKLSAQRLNEHAVIFGGDLLSVDRVRKAKRALEKCTTNAEALRFAIPMTELWHMKMNYAKAVVRLHWHDGHTRGTFGLAHDCTLLERNFNHHKCDFYPMYDILQLRFEALILDVARLICEEDTSIVHHESTMLLDGLSRYFGANGPLSKCTFEQLYAAGERIYQRYMTNTASEDCQSHRHWTPDAYGQHTQASSSSDASSSLPTPPPTPQGSSTPLPTLDSPVNRTSGGAHNRRTKKVNQPAVYESATWTGDTVLNNNINFLRMSFSFFEFSNAGAEGDIGRVYEMMKIWRFSFWGAGCTNYGNELLELACNFLYEFCQKMRQVFMENWLVNPSGRAGHWHEFDLLLEHYNFWIKLFYNVKSLDFDSPFLRDCVSLNLRGFNLLRDKLRDWFDIAKASGRHADAKMAADINKLGMHYRTDKVLVFVKGRTQPYTAPNEFKDGYDKLVSGQLDTFIQRTTRDTLHDMSAEGDRPPEAGENVDVDEGLSRLPANPLVFADGVGSMSEFNLGDGYAMS